MDSHAPKVATRVYRNAGNLPLLDLLPGGGGRILDCGCGAGDNARILKARGWRVTGITLSSEEQRLAAEHCERVFVSDLQQPLPEAVGAGYDAVLLSHVLEHLVAPETLLAQVRRLLAPNGVVAVALPNVLFYPIRLGALAGRFEYSADGIMDETHVRFYTFQTGAELLRASGFEVPVARADGGFPLWKLRRLLPAAIIDRIDLAACRARPGLFGRQSLYLARPQRAPG
jgi:2-polyprenyl-3-methyl-5-hydroxy-6-metoxy-1,4-benzoquinol methylase